MEEMPPNAKSTNKKFSTQLQVIVVTLLRSHKYFPLVNSRIFAYKETLSQFAKMHIATEATLVRRLRANKSAIASWETSVALGV